MALNETACDADSTCLWKSDDFGEMGGWCDVACFNPDTNQSSCEAVNGGGVIVPSETETIEDAGEDVDDDGTADDGTQDISVGEDVGATDVTEEVAEETGRAALAGMAWSDIGQAIVDLTWLWVTMAIVAVVVGLIIYIKRRK